MIKERTYTWRNGKGEQQSLTVKYTLHYNNGVLTNVINQNGYTCEKNSEVFEYFTKNQ